MTAFGFVNMLWFSGVAHSKQLTCRFSGKLKFSPIIATNEYVKKRYQMVSKKGTEIPKILIAPINKKTERGKKT